MYDKLKSEMKKRNLTTNKLAKISNITPQDLYSAFKGNKPMFGNWKKRIAEALETDVDSLFDENNTEV